MGQPKRQAMFFVTKSGAIFRKAPPLTEKQRRTVFERDGGVCCACKTNVSRFKPRNVYSDPLVGAIDHIIPRSRGGQNDINNLRLLCETCNSQKGAKLDNEWGVPCNGKG